MTRFETGSLRHGRIDRREFLGKSAVGGALVVGGVLTTGAGSALAASKPQYLGYRVGDQAADISGPDQYNRAAKLSGLLGSWVLVDLCPWWCGPCQNSAFRTRAFLDAVNAQGNPQGLSLKLLSVCTQKVDSSPSGQLDAEKWAVIWGLEKGVVLHCAGDPNSNLLQLFAKYGNANANPGGSYPTYVLVDPLGVIRYYQAFADLDEIQANLAQLSGKTLTTGPWDTTTAANVPANLRYGPHLASGKVAYTLGGTAISKTVAMPYSGGDFSLDDDEAPETSSSAQSDPTTITINLKLADPSQTIDPNSLISLSFATEFAHTYQRAGIFDPEEGIAVWDINAYDPNWLQDPNNNPPGLIALDAANVAPPTAALDGSSFGFQSFRIADLQPSGYYTGPANFVQAVATFSRTQPYAASNGLATDINSDTTLSSTVKSSATASLANGRSKMTKRDFVGAATAMKAAATTLRSASAVTGLRDTADWIASHVGWLAAH